MTDLLRQEVAATADTIVVKVGTRVLTDDSGCLDEDRIAGLAQQLTEAMSWGRRVLLVSSGAVGAGISALGLTERPKDLATLQAVAAIGQSKLIETYDRALRKHDRHAAQVLLSAGDLDDRSRYLNVRNTLLKLLELGALPIVNENDTVAVEELRTAFGDNDRLASLVTGLIGAPLLIILSDVAGLCDGDPRQPGANLIPTVPEIDDAVLSLVRDRATGLSKGGMASKLNAARAVTRSGDNVIIASGRQPDVIPAILRGESVGTLFLAGEKRVAPRKRWLGYSRRPAGTITVDDGARRALCEQGRSLLAIGVTAIGGEFVKGDLVAIQTAAGPFARGLSNYDASELRQIRGLPSDDIARVLGNRPYEEVVHRDNLVILQG